MKILFEVTHPAHVHFFKHTIWNLKDRGHDVFIEARDKEMTLDLLDVYKLDYNVVGPHYKSLAMKAYGLIKTDFKLLKIAHGFKPDILVGRGSVYLAHLSGLIKKPYLAFVDTEQAHLVAFLTFPFTDVILTPSCFQKRINPKKHIKFNGYKELAYLHPNYFKPDTSVLEELGLSKKDKFIVLRSVSWEASHDIGDRGFTDLEKVAKSLEQYGRVFITSEKKLPPELEQYKITVSPEKIHHILYFAHLYIGESATMTTESAILGTPAIFVSTAKSGNIDELENKYGLVYTFSDPKTMQRNALEKAFELLEDENVKKKSEKKRRKLLSEKIDVTRFMVDFIENYPESLHNLQR